MAIPLIQGLKSEVVVRNEDSAQIFPNICPQSYEDSVNNALRKLHPDKLSSIKQIQAHTGHLRLLHFCTQKEGMIIE